MFHYTLIDDSKVPREAAVTEIPFLGANCPASAPETPRPTEGLRGDPKPNGQRKGPGGFWWERERVYCMSCGTRSREERRTGSLDAWQGRHPEESLLRPNLVTSVNAFCQFRFESKTFSSTAGSCDAPFLHFDWHCGPDSGEFDKSSVSLFSCPVCWIVFVRSNLGLSVSGFPASLFGVRVGADYFFPRSVPTSTETHST